MKSVTMRQLQKCAVVLTAVVVLQIVWSGARLLFLSKPDPIYPAEASLQVDDIRYAMGADDEQSTDLVSRPVFWRDRQAYVPPEEAGDKTPAEEAQGSKSIDDVELHGVYTGATPGIIISYQGERRRLLLNESIEDWAFTMMSPYGAVFESGEDMRILNLEHAVPAPRKGGRTKVAGRVRTPDDTSNTAPDSEKQGTTNNDEKTGE